MKSTSWYLYVSSNDVTLLTPIFYGSPAVPSAVKVRPIRLLSIVCLQLRFFCGRLVSCKCDKITQVHMTEIVELHSNGLLERLHLFFAPLPGHEVELASTRSTLTLFLSLLLIFRYRSFLYLSKMTALLLFAARCRFVFWVSQLSRSIVSASSSRISRFRTQVDLLS